MSLEQCSMHLHLPRSRETRLWTFLLFAMLRGPHRLWRILNLCHYQGGSLNLTPPYLSEILQKSIANQGFLRDLGMKIQPSGKQRCVINFQKYQIEYDRQKTLCNICFIKNYVEVVYLFLIRIILSIVIKWNLKSKYTSLTNVSFEIFTFLFVMFLGKSWFFSINLLLWSSFP